MGELGLLIKEVMVAFYGYIKFWQVIDHWEEGVRLRWGRYKKSYIPGVYIKWPLADFFLTANVKDDTVEISPSAITTLDNKTISIGVVVMYKIVDVKLFLVEHNDSLSNFTDIVKGELCDLVEDTIWVDLRKKTARTILKNKLLEYAKNLGISVDQVKFTSKSEVRAFKLFTTAGKEINKPTLL